MNVGELTDKLFKLRQEKTELSDKLKDIEASIENYTYLAIENMKDLGLDKLTTACGTVTLKQAELYPTVKDKDAFIDWAVQNEKKEMLIIRANQAAFKEYFAEMGAYPEGVDGYYADKLNFRKK